MVLPPWCYAKITFNPGSPKGAIFRCSVSGSRPDACLSDANFKSYAQTVAGAWSFSRAHSSSMNR